MTTPKEEKKVLEELLTKELDTLENAISDENHALAVCAREEIWKIVDRIAECIRREAIAEERDKNKVTEDTSDGYHTFKELYEFRKIYNAVLFNEWARQGKYNVHKSKKHSDGHECFGGGWFIVVATLPSGDISNHYELKDWDLFNCEEREIAKEWDGHTAEDVIERLSHLTQE